MDDFTIQCLKQNLTDFNSGRITKHTYINTLLSLFKYKSGGYINNDDYVVYPDVHLPSEETTSSEGEDE